MKFWKVCALTVACLAALALASPDMADARRMGGGRSFGSSPTMRSPSTAPRPPAGATVQQPGSTMNRQATAPGGAATARRGLFGGMGGLFGGLLAGSLIGSMLMGHGFAGGAGLLDILLIGLVVYLIFRFVRRRNQGNTDATGYRSSAYGRNSYDQDAYGERSTASARQGAGSAWDNLTSGGARSATNPDMPRSSAIPADFDQEEFLRGAKMAYGRMQESWDRRDLDDIAQFATPAVMEELKKQYAEEPDPSTTELLLVNASLMEVKEEQGLQRAAVFFDVLMREDPGAQQPEQVREVWHFVRPLDSRESWKLDGIQQVA